MAPLPNSTLNTAKCETWVHTNVTLKTPQGRMKPLEKSPLNPNPKKRRRKSQAQWLINNQLDPKRVFSLRKKRRLLQNLRNRRRLLLRKRVLGQGNNSLPRRRNQPLAVLS